MDLLARTAAAAAIFAATNVDNMLLLVALFCDPRARPTSIVAGQFLGSSIIILASVLAALTSLRLPSDAIALLGLLPLAIGVRRLFTARPDSIRRLTLPPVPGLGPLPQRSLRSPLVAVASITVANGGDNFGAYAPLFARLPGQIPFYIVTFTGLTALSCLAGYHVSNRLGVSRRTLRLVGWLAPIVMIALGVRILSGLVHT